MPIGVVRGTNVNTATLLDTPVYHPSLTLVVPVIPAWKPATMQELLNLIVQDQQPCQVVQPTILPHLFATRPQLPRSVMIHLRLHHLPPSQSTLLQYLFLLSLLLLAPSLPSGQRPLLRLQLPTLSRRRPPFHPLQRQRSPPAYTLGTIAQRPGARRLLPPTALADL